MKFKSPTAQPIDPRQLYLWGGIVFITALVLRIIFLFQFRSIPLFDTPVMDMTYYHQWALALIEGRDFIEGPYFKAPMYPIFLSVVYRLFGDGPWPIKIVQVLMGSLSAVLTLLIGARVFNLKVGIVAGFMVAICGTLILYDGLLLVPSLAIFLNLLAVYCLIRGLQSGRRMLLLLSGLILGLSAVARPTVLPFTFVIIVLLLWEYRRRRRLASVRPVVLFALGVLLAILPVTIRNYVESGEVVLIGTYGGINLYIGNHLQSDGVSTRLPGTGIDWWGQGTMADAERLAETDVGRELSATEHTRYWRSRAIKEMASHPGFLLKHLLRKFLLLIGGLELANNFDIYYLAYRIPLLSVLVVKAGVLVPWGVLFPLAVAGLFLLTGWTMERRVVAAFLLAYTPSLLLFFVTARYRLPMVPFLSLFASYALASGYGVLKRTRGGKRVLVTGVFVIAALVSHIDFYGFGIENDAQGHQLMAALYKQQGNVAEAERYFRQALEADSTLPHANNDLGLLHLSRGETEPAIRLLQRAVRYEPEDYLLRYNLGTAYLNAGREADAVVLFQSVLEQAPDYSVAANNMGLAWLRLGYPDSALAAYRLITGATPDKPEGHFGVGYCYHLLGNTDSALVCYRRSLALDSTYGRALYGLGQLWLQRGATDSCRAYLTRFLEVSSGEPDLETEAARTLDSLARR